MAGTERKIITRSMSKWTFKKYLFIYFACAGSLLLCMDFLSLQQVGATSYLWCTGSLLQRLPCCGAQALGTRAQWLWCMGLVVPWRVGSSQTRNLTGVPCVARWIHNHWTTREAQKWTFKKANKWESWSWINILIQLRIINSETTYLH